MTVLYNIQCRQTRVHTVL